MTIRRAWLYLALEFLAFIACTWPLRGVPVVYLILLDVVMILIGRHAHVLSLLYEDRQIERVRDTRATFQPEQSELRLTNNPVADEARLVLDDEPHSG
jgi:hypothetical protein